MNEQILVALDILNKLSLESVQNLKDDVYTNELVDAGLVYYDHNYNDFTLSILGKFLQNLLIVFKKANFTQAILDLNALVKDVHTINILETLIGNPLAYSYCDDALLAILLKHNIISEQCVLNENGVYLGDALYLIKGLEEMEIKTPFLQTLNDILTSTKLF